MTRPIVVIGAPSSIGIKPYPDGTQRRLDLAADPQLDADGASGTRLAQLLTRVLRNATTRLVS